MIHTESLARTFRVGKETVEAVRGIDLDVAEGELVAFLGPNGAGKSTTLRMLTSLLPPTSGSATVAGVDVVANPAEVRRRIGYIGQKDGAGHNYRVRDELLMRVRSATERRQLARQVDLLQRQVDPPGSLGALVGRSAAMQRVKDLITRAAAAGGTVLQPVKDQFYGDRSGTLRDPFGHVWNIATHKEDLSPEEMHRRAQAAMKQHAGA